MSAIVTDTSPQALSSAVEANMFAATPVIFGATPQSVVEDTPERLLYALGLPFSPFNGVCRACFEPDTVAIQVRETMDFFRARQLPMMWWIGPSCRPADLGRHLEAEGLIWSSATPGMAIELTALPAVTPLPEDTQILETAEEATLTLWAEACRRGFQMPEAAGQALIEMAKKAGFGVNSPLRNFFLLENGQPVAAASLCMAAGIAGIYCVSTAPEARRKGYATALVLEALRAAHRLGYAIGILQSSAMGRPVYERLGFKEVCSFQIYRWEGEKPETKTETEGTEPVSTVEVI